MTKALLLALTLLTACGQTSEAVNVTTLPGQTLTQIVSTYVDGSELRHDIIEEGFSYPPTFETADVTLSATGYPVIAHGTFPIPFTVDRSTMTKAEQWDMDQAVDMINMLAGRELFVESESGFLHVQMVTDLDGDNAGECVGTSEHMEINIAIGGVRTYGTMSVGVWFHEAVHALDFTAVDGSDHEQTGILAARPTEFLVTARIVAYLRYLGSPVK